ncbi:MAG: hypothetical protein KFF73_15290 [Cyclobacteriaceae bacterium]|nr:hypothetical protein [Cyclobacteriaceae bacterium]
MKFLAKFIVIGILTYSFEQFLPWWSIALAAFLGGMILKSRGINAFLAGALGVGLIWLWVALRIDYQTNSILTSKIALIFQLENKNLLIAITVLLGSTIGAFSAWTGYNFRCLFERKKRQGYYS